MAAPLRLVSDVPLDPVIVYTRKSSEDGNAQVHSHDQQLESIWTRVEKANVCKYFADDKSGKTFDDRAGFQEMLRWCRKHPQPRDRPGRIWMYDKSRFGRALVPGTNETDWIAYDRARLSFAELGWTLEFVKSERTGNQIVDRIMDTLDDEQSSEYIRRLRSNVMRGQNAAIKAGYWCRGIAPFPCARADARTGRLLEPALVDDTGAVVREGKRAVQPAERAQPGARVILVPDPGKLVHWIRGAEMLLNGSSWRSVLAYYTANVRTARGGSARWTRKGLKRVYTNEALLGIQVRKVDGRVQTFQAAWEPVVDPGLFEQVGAEIVRREQQYSVSNRQCATPYMLRNVHCAQCGAKYVGGLRQRSSTGKSVRYYVHPDVRETERVTKEQLGLGCKHYSIPADYLEQQVRNLILEQRGTEGFAETIAQLYEEQLQFKDTHASLVDVFKERVAEAKSNLANLLEVLKKAKGATQDLVLAQVEAQQVDLESAERDLAAAATRATASNADAAMTLETIKETELVLGAWGSKDWTARQRVIDYWVVDIVVTPVPQKRKSTVFYDKLCRVYLRKVSDASLEILVPGLLRPDGDGYFNSKNCPIPTRSMEPGCEFLSSAQRRITGVGIESGSYQRVVGKFVPTAFEFTVPGLIRFR